MRLPCAEELFFLAFRQITIRWNAWWAIYPYFTQPLLFSSIPNLQIASQLYEAGYLDAMP